MLTKGHIVEYQSKSHFCSMSGRAPASWEFFPPPVMPISFKWNPENAVSNFHCSDIGRNSKSLSSTVNTCVLLEEYVLTWKHSPPTCSTLFIKAFLFRVATTIGKKFAEGGSYFSAGNHSQWQRPLIPAVIFLPLLVMPKDINISHSEAILQAGDKPRL